MPDKDEAAQSDGAQEISFDPAQVDVQYTPFPPFSDWSDIRVDNERWETFVARLDEWSNASEELLERALEVVKRAAAIETGAIEGLYEVERGFTYTVATEAATLRAALSGRERRTRTLIKSQIAAYDYVLDFATGEREVREAWVRSLHEVVCDAQETFKVRTPQGWQDRDLPLGQYKTEPNHPMRADGTVHAFAPVDDTEDEMRRLCEELRSDAFKKAHPILKASYAHYGLVAIHPFADGNGRVARALASVYTYQSVRTPLLILADHQHRYFASLQRADQGEYQPFVFFTQRRVLDAMQMVEESLKTAEVPSPDQALDQLDDLYLTRGGYTHHEVEQAAQELYSYVVQKLQERKQRYESGRENFTLHVGTNTKEYEPEDPGYRVPVKGGGKILLVTLSTSPPGKHDHRRGFRLEVPTDAGEEDTIRLYSPIFDDALVARIDEILPTPRSTLELRAEFWLDRTLSRMLDELAEASGEELKRQGYL